MGVAHVRKDSAPGAPPASQTGPRHPIPGPSGGGNDSEHYRSLLAESRRQGWSEGESFARVLAEQELRERTERLSRPPTGWLEPAAQAGELARLERELARLGAFHDAVLRSRSWRLLQGLRRLLGRAW